MRTSFTDEQMAEIVAGGIARQTGHPPSDRDSLRTQVDPNSEHMAGYGIELAGEIETGIPMNRTLQRGGDGLRDFTVGSYTIDLKGRRAAHWPMLIKEYQLVDSDHHIYVHAWVNLPGKFVHWHGYTLGSLVKNSRLMPARGHGMTHRNFEVGTEELNPAVNLLFQAMRNWKNGQTI